MNFVKNHREFIFLLVSFGNKSILMLSDHYFAYCRIGIQMIKSSAMGMAKVYPIYLFLAPQFSSNVKIIVYYAVFYYVSHILFSFAFCKILLQVATELILEHPHFSQFQVISSAFLLSSLGLSLGGDTKAGDAGCGIFC